jgi:hypothetical protein
VAARSQELIKQQTLNLTAYDKVYTLTHLLATHSLSFGMKLRADKIHRLGETQKDRETKRVCEKPGQCLQDDHYSGGAEVLSPPPPLHSVAAAVVVYSAARTLVVAAPWIDAAP